MLKDEVNIKPWNEASYAILVLGMIKKALVDYTEHNELEFIRDVDAINWMVPNKYKNTVDTEANKCIPDNRLWEHDKKVYIASFKLNVIRDILEPVLLRQVVERRGGGMKDDYQEDNEDGQQL